MTYLKDVILLGGLEPRHPSDCPAVRPRVLFGRGHSDPFSMDRMDHTKPREGRRRGRVEFYQGIFKPSQSFVRLLS